MSKCVQYFCGWYLNHKVINVINNSICLEILKVYRNIRKIIFLDKNFVVYTEGLNVGETLIE